MLMEEIPNPFNIQGPAKTEDSVVAKIVTEYGCELLGMITNKITLK